jgi:hypothetical protein
MAPYAAVYRGSYANGAYHNEDSLPLLTESGGFNGDMVFANRQVRGHWGMGGSAGSFTTRCDHITVARNPFWTLD